MVCRDKGSVLLPACAAIAMFHFDGSLCNWTSVQNVCALGPEQKESEQSRGAQRGHMMPSNLPCSRNVTRLRASGEFLSSVLVAAVQVLVLHAAPHTAGPRLVSSAGHVNVHALLWGAAVCSRARCRQLGPSRRASTTMLPGAKASGWPSSGAVAEGR